MFKINVDRATSENGRNSSVGVIIRDSQGLVVVACSRYTFGQFTAPEVEVLAIECGILFARELEFSQVLIESDALSVVQSIVDRETDGSLGHLYSSISQVLEFFSRWEIKLVKREYNRVVHELAQLARRNEASQRWIGVSPPIVQKLILADCS